MLINFGGGLGLNSAGWYPHMDNKEHIRSIFFSRFKPPPAKYEHLKPLSVYAEIIARDHRDGLRQFCNPCINFEIEVMNSSVKRRKLDSAREGYETPAKKPFSSNALSPDLGCFMDYSSPHMRQDSVSPFAVSKPALLNKTQAVRNEVKQIVSSHLPPEQVECRSSTESGDNMGTVPYNLRCEVGFLNVAPAVDCDVDAILCLNPIGTSAAGGFSDNVESCRNTTSDTFQNKSVLIPTVANAQELERGDGQVEEEREELKKEGYTNVKDLEEDKGYISLSYIKDPKTGKDTSRSPYPQLPPATSSPLLRIGEVEVPEDEYHSESSPEPSCHKQPALSGQHVSFTVSDFCPFASGPLLESGNSPLEALEGDTEEVWDIGVPIFESSLCHNVTVKLNTGSEQSRQVLEDVRGGKMEPIHECQATLGGKEATLDTSYGTTLPLKVQVKSVVVAPSQNPFSSKPAAPTLPEQNAEPTKPSSKENRISQPAKCVSRAGSQRVVDLEHDKQIYFHSVTRHLNENRGADQDVMTELLNLMTHVADQTPGTNGRQWQHPSDLTRRNYQRRFGNMMPTMALNEWQAKNFTTYKRFANVPKIFQRSPFP